MRDRVACVSTSVMWSIGLETGDVTDVFTALNAERAAWTIERALGAAESVVHAMRGASLAQTGRLLSVRSNTESVQVPFAALGCGRALMADELRAVFDSVAPRRASELGEENARFEPAWAAACGPSHLRLIRIAGGAMCHAFAVRTRP
jgi:hypothetical protein